MLNEIAILDLIGTFAFACYGSYFAMKKNFDLFGIFTCAFLTAVGGGTIREMILGHIPFYFYDQRYLVVILGAILFSINLYRNFHKINNLMLVLDAIGLAVFAFIGATKSIDAGLGLFGAIFFATITSVGGGLVRDIVMNEVPEIMHRDFYATVAIISGALFWLAKDYRNSFAVVNMLLAFCLCLRLAALKFKYNLWKPQKQMILQEAK